MYHSMVLASAPPTTAPGLQSQPNSTSSPADKDDDFDVDREQPREEKKFDMINSSLNSHTLTTVNEQQSDFNDTIGALNRDNEAYRRVHELTQTAKRDDQVQTMTKEMR